MRVLLALALLALCAARVAAVGEGDEDDAVPGLIPSGGMNLYYDSTGPMSFPAMTPRDVPKDARQLGEVVGRVCQRGLSIPISADIRGTSISGAYGDGGYVKALAVIKKAHPEVAGIYDVKTDNEVFSILGFYRSLCTVVTARAFALPVAPKH